MDEEEAKQALEAKRDDLARGLDDARQLSMNLQLENIDKYRGFLQKIGELSFIVGAAIVPVVIVSGTEKIHFLNFLIIGVAIYLINGLLSLWRAKAILERNSGDAPFVGLDEQIHTYPVVFAHNKIIFDLNNKEYREEYRNSSLAVIEWAQKDPVKEAKPKVSIWLDVLLINFVIASMFVARTVWPFPEEVYWVSFVIILFFMAGLVVVSYVKSWQNQINLAAKRKELADLKKDYQDWHNKNIFGKS